MARALAMMLPPMTVVWVRHLPRASHICDCLANLDVSTDLGLKKKKRKPGKKDAANDDEFAAKLAALDIEKDAEEDPAEQEGDMCVPCLCASSDYVLTSAIGTLGLASLPTTRPPP